jgi:mutator protein MutT
MQRIVVAAGLLFHQGRLLITQRREEDHLGGLWEFPGGKLETGETLEDCLRRELQEELGVAIQVGVFWESVVYDYPEKSVDLRFFLCTLLQHEPQPISCQALRWIQKSELDLFPFPPADAQLLRRLKDTPNLWTAGDAEE